MYALANIVAVIRLLQPELLKPNLCPNIQQKKFKENCCYFSYYFLGGECLQIGNYQSHCIPLILPLRSCIYSFSSLIISCMVGLALGSLCRHRRTRPRNAPFVTSTTCSSRLRGSGSCRIHISQRRAPKL